MGDVARGLFLVFFMGGCVIASLVFTVWVLYRIARAVRPVKNAHSTTVVGSTPLSPGSYMPSSTYETREQMERRQNNGLTIAEMAYGQSMINNQGRIP